MAHRTTTTSRTTSRPDPASQRFINQLRQQGLRGAGVARGVGPGGLPGSTPFVPREEPDPRNFNPLRGGGAFTDPTQIARPSFGIDEIGGVDGASGGGFRPPGGPFGGFGGPVLASRAGPDFDPVGTPGALPGPNPNALPVDPSTGAPIFNPEGRESFFIGADERPISEQIAPFFDPFQEQVVEATRGEFTRQRGLAGVAANQQATAAGAFGGDRAAIERGARIGAIDRAETSQIAGLLSGGFRDARDVAFAQNERNRQINQAASREGLFREQKALEFLNLGLGPVGTTVNTTTTGEVDAQGNPIGGAISGAIGGAAVGGIPGALIGGVIGGLGSLF